MVRALFLCPGLFAKLYAVKIALAQINPTVGALRANSEKIITFARRAVAEGAQLVIFPEMGICGYPPRDLVEKPEFVAAGLEWLRAASRAVPEVAILCGCPVPAAASTGKSVHNSALVLQAGEVIFQQSKMLLPTYDVFDELRNFAPAEQQRVWHWRGQRIAVTICEDAWNDKNYWPKHQTRLLYARDPVAEQLRAGADFLINISASPYTEGKIGLRQEMLSAIAREYGVPIVFVNQVGGDDQLIFDGSSLVLAAGGTLRARAQCLAEDLLVVDTADWRGELRPTPASETEAMFRALVLGTRDYIQKCGFERVVLGLSGGIDSALTAAIAAAAVGADRVRGLFLPTRHTSQESRRAVDELAGRLGIALETIDIEPMFALAMQSLAPQFDRAEASRADLAEQNLQSRLRGLVLMAASNLDGSLVLSTGNKSELAVGYCTLYGDMAGGLAVLSDVLKTQVYELAAYVNRDRERIPAAIIARPPTAELKFNQTDQDDLPPYPALDVLIREYVENYCDSRSIAARAGLSPELVAALIRRIDHSEYKRQQAAPGLKISRKAFGMGRRLPVAQRYEAPEVPGDRLPAQPVISGSRERVESTRSMGG